MEQCYIDKVNNIKGPIAMSECEKLHELASQVKEGVIVEIGSLTGSSAISLASGTKRKVYSVDPNPRGEFKGNTEEFKNIIQIRAYSKAAAKMFTEEVGLLFIDGDHTYEGVKTDYDSWLPHMIKGGVMAFHDYESQPGVTKVVEDNFKKFKQVASLAYA